MYSVQRQYLTVYLVIHKVITNVKPVLKAMHSQIIRAKIVVLFNLNVTYALIVESLHVLDVFNSIYLARIIFAKLVH